MGAPTQFAGLAAENMAAAASAGFLGWSPEADRTVHTLIGGSVYKGTYANSTAYAVGDVVTYAGNTYTAVQTVSSANTTAPVVGSVWRSASAHRGASQVSSPTVQLPSNYR